MHKKKEKPKVKKGIPRLFELAGQKKKKLIIACVLAVISSAARLVPFFTIYRIVKELISHNLRLQSVNTHTINTLILYTFISALVYGVCAFTSSVLAHRSAFEILLELRLQIINKLGRISPGFFTGTTQGAIKKTISDDVEQIEGFIAHHIVDIATAIALPILTLLYLFIMDWRLALATTISIIISVFMLASGLRKPEGAQTQKQMHDTKEKMEGTIVEYIHGMSVIKIFNRTLKAFKQFEQNVCAYVDSVEHTTHYFASTMGAYFALLGAQLLFLLPAGILLSITAASYQDFLPLLLLFFLVGSGLKEPFESMMSMVIHTQKITEGVSRIDKILHQPESQSSGDGNPVTYDVSFEEVAFAYDDSQQVVKNVSFHLSQGTVNGLVGPSGGGKSTIAQLLLRFYEPQQGRIKIGGVDIREIPSERLTDLVSYVFQDSFLFRDTIENNIRMGNKNASKEAVIKAAKGANIHNVIMKLPDGYDTVIGKNDAYLSGGEKQRIAIARVFLKDAPIVILDEATAYADAENETKIQQAFTTLAKNKTVLIIAHRLKSVENANQILVLDKGSLQGIGSHVELIQNCSLYQNMVDANERKNHWTIRKGA